MPRPTDLPDFNEPPLDEVVLGVQFAPTLGYTTVDARSIWDLYRSEFPRVVEQSPLSPQFETFGGVDSQLGVQFHFGQALTPNRLWFVSDDENHLLQFQPDRFLSNWRKNAGIVPYPHYEQISQGFELNLRQLGDHLMTSKGYMLDINQAEITYINIIPLDDFDERGKWLKLWAPPKFSIEALHTTFSEVIRDADNKPFARLYHELQSVASLDGKNKAFRFSMTYRGKPTTPDIDGALDFLAKGRNAIVKRFAELTTKQAHSAWKRVQ